MRLEEGLEETCINCDDYTKINLRAKCGEGHNMSEMKKKGYPCFSRHFLVMGNSKYKDEFDNICED